MGARSVGRNQSRRAPKVGWATDMPHIPPPFRKGCGAACTGLDVADCTISAWVDPLEVEGAARQRRTEGSKAAAPAILEDGLLMGSGINPEKLQA